MNNIKEELMEYVNSLKNFNSHNNITITKIENNYAQGVCKITKNSLNPLGTAHGGVIYSLADAVMGMAAASTGKKLVTQCSNISYFKSVTKGNIRCDSTCLKEGKNVSVFDAKIYDDNNNLIAYGTFNAYFMGNIDIEKDIIK
ncbi:MAG: PaaI family thioesterase [Bacilli bacterium]